MADMPFQIILPSVFVSYIFFMTSQPFDGLRLGMVILMCILTSLVAQSLGLVIGCACDEKSAVFLDPISIIPLLLFSGFFIKLTNIPSCLHWISYVAFIRYGYGGTMVAIYGNDREHLDCGTNGTSVIEIQAKFLCDPKNILEKLSLEEKMFYDVAVLSGFFAVLRLIGLFILWCRVKSEH
jgi:ATP-binding cassette subfamily G (WHITE) protein 1